MSGGTLKLAQIQDAIYHFIKKELAGAIDDSSIIWRNQSQPLPPRPCVTMKITDGPRPVGGLVDNLYDASGDRFTNGQQMEMTVSIQVFGNTQVHRPMAYQLTLDLHSALSKESVRQDLRKAGIAVHGRGEPKNITALEETEYEERAQFDVLLGVAQNVVDDPGTIETVTGSGTVNTKSVPYRATV